MASFFSDPDRLVTLMPMGDSITEADPGWRNDLFDLLTGAGCKVEFVGSMSGDPKSHAPRHEGHAGFIIGPGRSLADDWSDGKGNLYDNVDAWLKIKPDLILVLIGTNDYWNIRDMQPGYNPEVQGPDRIAALLDKMHAASPASKILVSSVLPIESNNHHAEKLNGAMPGLVATRPYATFVDLNKTVGFVSADWSDGVHLSEVGNRKVAEGWFAALTTAN